MIYFKGFKLENKNMFLKIKTLKEIFPGMHVFYQNKEYVCYERISKLINGIIVNEIFLANNSSFIIDKLYNNKVKGASILGKVLEVVTKENKGYLKVDLEFGLENKNKGNQTKNNNHVLIPFKTFYSQNDTGLFPAPEYGDIVDVVFYSKDESETKVSWSLENKESYRFTNNTIRTFKNKNLNFKLEDSNLEILGLKNTQIKSDELHINTNTVVFKTNKNFMLASDGNIVIESIEDMMIYFKEGKIYSKSKNISIISESDIILKAKTIHTT